MGSPFPGMDPYLEGPWGPDFHHELAVETKRHLLPLLRPHYFPFIERYVLLSSDALAIAGEQLRPDVGIAEAKFVAPRPPKGRPHAAVMMEMPKPLEIAHHRVLIRDAENHQVITIIEFLSPTNKRGDGRGEYMEKRNQVLNSSTHLVEIDLLRGGQRLPVKGQLPAGSYYVFVSRSEQRPKVRVWAIALEGPLPVIPIPLRKKREDVRLDLQEVIRKTYELGGYDGIIDYREAPAAPLSEKELAWLDRRLRAAGMRHSRHSREALMQPRSPQTTTYRQMQRTTRG